MSAPRRRPARSAAPGPAPAPGAGATQPPAEPCAPGPAPAEPGLDPAVAALLAAGIRPPGLLATILDVADLLVSVVDREGRVLVWNRACAALSGYSFEEVRGRPFYDLLLPPDEAARIREVFARLGEQEPRIRAENHWITRSGELRLIVWSNSVVRGPDGAVQYLVGTGVDITEQHQARAEARISEERYRALFEHASIAIFIAEPEGLRFVDANPSACEMLAMPRERLVGRTAYELLEPGSPYLPPDPAAMGNDRTLSSLRRLVRGDGRVIDVEIGTRLLPDGRYVSVVRDVTEQRRAAEELRASETRHRDLAGQLRLSEARYRNLYDAMVDPFVWVTLDGRLVEFSRSYERMTGYTADELHTMNYRDLTPERWWEFEQRIIEEQVLTRGWSDPYEKEYRHRDGTVFPVELRAAVVCDEAGRPASMWAIVRDVSARQAAERALREGEERYRAVVEQASEGITLTDPEWRFLDVNPRVCEMFGYSREELLGMTVRELGAPEDLAAHPLHGPELSRGETITTERHIRRKDGTSFTAEVSARGLPDGRVVSVVRDVTERLRMERALRASEERARRIIESDLLGIVIVEDGRIVDANGYALKLLGLPRDEAIAGALPARLFLRPEEAEQDEARAVELRRTGVCREFEREVTRRDGTRVPVLIGGALLPAEGAALRTVWFALDLTERKRTEQRLVESERYLQRARGLARLGTWDVDLVTMTVTFSPELKVLLGLPADTPTVPFPESLRRLFHPDDWPGMEEIIREQAAHGGVVNFSHRVVHPDGSVRMLEATAEAVLDETGRTVRIIGAARDVTDQRAMEQQLREAQKLEAIGRLAGGVAHDFNNLLTVILGFSEALLETLPEEGDERASAGQIQTAARRAAGLTQQLLAFGRRQRLRLGVFDLNAVLGEMRDILRRLLGEHIAIVITPDPRPAFVHADRGQVEQVILNLALNARDAMPLGGRMGIVTRRAKRPAGAPRGAPERWVELEVSDTGSGMTPEVQAHIFEPFFSTKDVGRGTGLGLATVYGIVTQSGGQILVESAPERGSTFRVYLPCTDAEVEAIPEAPPGEQPRGDESLLLVEDEDAVRGLVAQVLRSSGYRVHEAPGPEEALRIAAREPFDLLVTDVVMPGMSGSQLAARLRAARPELPVLFISGYTDQSMEPDAADPLTGYLQKPFTPVAFATRIRQLLDWRGPSRG